MVIVNCIDGTTLRGLLWRSRGAWLVLKDAALLKALPGAVAPNVMPIDGDVVIRRDKVLFLQALP